MVLSPTLATLTAEAAVATIKYLQKMNPGFDIGELLRLQTELRKALAAEARRQVADDPNKNVVALQVNENTD
jgi:hypothetical protein